MSSTMNSLKFTNKFDVFVSFRGIDTGRSFVSHLRHSLFKKKFRTFKHEQEDLLVNQPAFPHVLQAIEESKVAVVVISKNYTSSISCLDELVKIIECKEEGSLVVVPVFYEVDTSDFERQAEHLADELKKLRERNNVGNARMWEDALIEMTRTFQDYASRVEEDSDMIDKVIDYIYPYMITSSEFKTALGSGSLRPPRTSLENALDVFKNMSEMDDEEESIKSFNHTTRPGMYGQNVEEDSDMSDKVIDYISPPMITTSKFRMTLGSGSLRPPITNHGNALDVFKKMSEMDDVEESIKSFNHTTRPGMYGEKYVTGNELSRLVPSSDFDTLLGMDRHMESMNKLLQLESKNVTLDIGIWGEVWVGKTTLSRYIYRQISPKFQDHYYHNSLNDTTNYSPGRKSTCLLEELTRAIMMPISSSLFTRYSDLVTAKLGHRKVLLIVDGVDHIDQLKYISKIVYRFGQGSRLIIVTQHKNLLLQCEVRRLYEVEYLKFDEALQLFSQFAFKEKYITRGFDQLCARAVLIAGRLPLALKVFGSFLCGKKI